jgi:Zn-finger protein
MNKKVLGKIEDCYFGFCEFYFGLWLTLSGEWGGVIANYHFIPTHDNELEKNERCVKMINNVIKIMKDAKVDSIQKLIGKPVEVELENDSIVNFRILTEVL